MSEVINREVTETDVIYTLDDGTTRQAPREFIDQFDDLIHCGMALLEAEGHSSDEAAAMVKKQAEDIILRHFPDETAA